MYNDNNQPHWALQAGITLFCISVFGFALAAYVS